MGSVGSSDYFGTLPRSVVSTTESAPSLGSSAFPTACGPTTRFGEATFLLNPFSPFGVSGIVSTFSSTSPPAESSFSTVSVPGGSNRVSWSVILPSLDSSAGILSLTSVSSVPSVPWARDTSMAPGFFGASVGNSADSFSWAPGAYVMTPTKLIGKPGVLGVILVRDSFQALTACFVSG